jgi:hypothetical protein
VLAALAASCSAAACGDDGGDQPPAVTIETSDRGPNKVTMRAPRTVAAGLVEIELRNDGDTPHDAQLFRVDGDRTSADVVGLLEQADSAPKPRWLHPAGGVAPIDPGETATVTQVLEPGTYYVTDTQERTIASGGHLINAARGGVARLEVRGTSRDELPETAATITAREYGYDAEGFVAGENRVTFRNAGREFHQAVAFPVGDDVPYAEGKQEVLGRQQATGWVPVDAPDERATTVLEGGGEQIAELTLDPGRYVLLCFVSDRAGGGPQWAIGMTRKLEIAPD